MNQKKFHQAMIDCVSAETYCTMVLKRKKFQHFECEIYADYRDELDERNIKKIVESDDPMQTFYEIMDDFYIDEQGQLESEMIQKVIEEFPEYSDIEDSFELEEEIREWFHNYVYWKYPIKHYLNEEICINITVDYYGDSNYDFSGTCAMYNDTGKLKNSSLIWLVHSQGYKMDDFYRALNGEKTESKFLKSAVQEYVNVSSGMNATVFFVKMTLEEYIKYKEKPTNYHIHVSTNCGLVDFWHGAGGILEIELEKPIVINKKNIFKIEPDFCYNYSVKDIFGVADSLWY